MRARVRVDGIAGVEARAGGAVRVDEPREEEVEAALDRVVDGGRLTRRATSGRGSRGRRRCGSRPPSRAAGRRRTATTPSGRWRSSVNATASAAIESSVLVRAMSPATRRLALWTGHGRAGVVGEPALAVALHGKLRRGPRRPRASTGSLIPSVEERVRGEHRRDRVRLSRGVEAPARLHVEAVRPAARLGLWRPTRSRRPAPRRGPCRRGACTRRRGARPPSCAAASARGRAGGDPRASTSNVCVAAPRPRRPRATVRTNGEESPSHGSCPAKSSARARRTGVAPPGGPRPGSSSTRPAPRTARGSSGRGASGRSRATSR